MVCRLHKHQVIDLFVLEALPISLDCLIIIFFKTKIVLQIHTLLIQWGYTFD